jgi:hypothetical protein
MIMIVSGTPEEKRMKRSNGPLKGMRRRENEYAQNTPAIEAMAVEITAKMTLFNNECKRLPLRTFLKFTNEK